MSTATPPPIAQFRDVPDHGDGHVKHEFGTTDLHHQEEKPCLTTEGDIKILKTVSLNADGMCCKFSEDSERLAVGLSNGVIMVFKASTGSPIYHLADSETTADKLPVTSINFLPANSSSRGELLIATYASGMIKYWHVASKQVLITTHEKFQILTSSLSPYSDLNRHLIVGGCSEEIMVYDIEVGKRIQKYAPSPNRLVMDGHRFRIFTVKHHPADEHAFLSGGWDDTIQIWDQREEHAIRRIFGPHVCGDGIDIDVKHNHVLTASWRKHNVLQVWDYGSGNRIKNIPPDFSADSQLYCGQWLGKNHMISGGSDNNMIRIIDKSSLTTSGMITNLPSGVYSIDHDKVRLAHHHSKSRDSDVTLITAVAGQHLYFISDAVQPKRE